MADEDTAKEILASLRRIEEMLLALLEGQVAIQRTLAVMVGGMQHRRI